MPRPRALPGPEAARQSLAQRLTRTADRLRQFNTRFGLRSRRVFLVWTQWTGVERGEGEESVLARCELLPTPRITDGTALSRRGWPTGVMLDGQLRIDQISAGAYTEDNLRGLAVPSTGTVAPRGSVGAPVGGLSRVDPDQARTIDFYYEIVEDGRGDTAPARGRFRVSAKPWRNEGGLYWGVMVEAAEDEPRRDGDLRQDELDLLGRGG